MIIRVKEKVFNVGVNYEENIYIVKLSNLGQQGLSAYQIAVLNGFEGTEQEWLDSLQATGIQSIVAGTNITIDDTDPANPIISASGGGGGTPNLQEVLEQGASFSLSQGTATNTGQLGDFNVGQNSFRDSSVMQSVDGDITRTTTRSGSKAGYGIVNEVYNESTEVTKQGQLSVLEGDTYLDGSLTDNISPENSKIGGVYVTDGEVALYQTKRNNDQASLKLNPGEGLNPEYTTADDEDGEQTLATRAWVQANAEPALGFTPLDIAKSTYNFVSCKTVTPATPVAGQGGAVWVEVYKKLIPANTFTDLDEISVEGRIIKTNTNNTTIVGIFIHAVTDNFGAATLIGSAGTWNAGSQRCTIRREYVQRGNNLSGIVTSFSNPTDEQTSLAGGAANTYADFAFNPTQDNWIYLAIRGSSTSDLYQKELFEVKITPNLP